MGYNLEGLDTVVNIVNEFARKFNCQALASDDFCADVHNSKIYFTLVCSEQNEKEFMESVYRCNPKVKMDIFLWSLLHEIFHIETYDNLTEEELNYCDDMKEEIIMGRVNRMKYYDLPIEKLATEGAVKYANTHIEELAKFWSKLQPAIMEFYKLNDIH